MRILFLSSAASTHTSRWVNAISSEGHEVHLLTLDPAQVRLDPGIRCYRTPFPPKWGYVANWPWARKLVAEVKPDLIHAHYATGYGILAALVDFHPTILSVWGSDVFDFPHQSLWHRRLLEFNLSRADKVLSTSHVMAAETAKYTSKPIEVTPFGIDTSQFLAIPELRDPGTITIGTVKKLAPKYGIDVLIRAFAILREAVERELGELLPRLRLLIVGGGPDETKLKELAAELGVDGLTRFVGAVPHAEVPNYLNRMDVYTALSRLDSESFGVAILEASACGLPVVVSDAGGLPEVVKDGETGFIVEREDPAAAADALLQLITDATLRRRMGAAGREHVIESYEWSDSVSLMEDVYAQVLKKASVGVAS